MVKGTSNVSFKYNDAGIRTQKTVNGVTTKYYLDGDKVTLEDNGTDKIYYTYDSAGQLISMTLNGVEYYYIRNAQGDIIGLFDSTGTQVVSYSYDSWGKLISTTGTLASTVGVKNPYRYRGYRYDTETGLYYLQSRYYNPEWGRFINSDDEGGKVGALLSHNVFAYAMNNPVNMSDPDGHWPKWATIAIIAAVVIVAVVVVAIVAPEVLVVAALTVARVGATVGTAVVATASKVGQRAGPAVSSASQAVSRGADAAAKEVRVIGHYPEYIEKARELSTRPFSIPDRVWNEMSEAGRWAANQKFLDQAISKGAEFVLATPLDKVRPGSYLEKEIGYLVSQGYKLAEDGIRLFR